MYSAMVAERAICRQTASVNGVNKCERIAAGEPCLEPQLIERHDDTSALQKRVRGGGHQRELDRRRPTKRDHR
jgi:hypothetical protein